MVRASEGRLWPSLDELIEAYESALATGDAADLAAFAPGPDHPERLPILCELVRVDLDHRWSQDDRRPLEDYQPIFPDLFASPPHLRAMAFEEMRLRRQAGEQPDPADYRRRFDVDPEGVGSSQSASRPASGSQRPVPAADDAAALGRAASVYRDFRRRGASDPTSLDVLLESRSVRADHAELLRALDAVDPHAAEQLADGLSGFPRVGANFLGFRLCGELGRGAFGRVYLARQGDLADRLVALKVSADVTGESRALAQLQHTNIVPIYSLHRAGALNAVCMPYLGATTMADTLQSIRSQGTLPQSGEGLLSSLRSRSRKSGGPPSGGSTLPGSAGAALPASDGIAEPQEVDASAPPPPQIERLSGLNYVPAVLWLMTRIADGLAHAHERGILHRDLKPANVLIADDGEPLLLDFNLAADVKARVGAATALVGGTLPYMAPEHLESFRKVDPRVDARSDVYSLGVILHEFLTGAHPFPIHKGAVDDVLPRMIADRLAPLPDARKLNPAISPAVASILRKSLEPDPERRYRSARAFQEDLQRQLDNLPLRHAPEPSIRERAAKWARRHPRLTSTTTVAVLCLAVVTGLGAAYLSRVRHYEQVEALASSQRLADDYSEASASLVDLDGPSDWIDRGLDLADRSVAPYGVLNDPRWSRRPMLASLPDAERTRTMRQIGELLVLSSRALLRRTQPGSAPDRVAVRLDRASDCFGPEGPPQSLLLARAELARASGAGEDEVKRLTTEAEAVPLRSLRERMLAAAGRQPIQERRRTLAFLEAAEGRDARDMDYGNWLILGNLCHHDARPTDAEFCYGLAVSLGGDRPWPRFYRGALRLEQQDYPGAIEDFDRFVRLQPSLPVGYLNRALARMATNDPKGAIADLTRCLELKGAPSRTWFIRAKAREQLGDRDGAKLDREQGLRVEPTDLESRVARGFARLPDDPNGALADFDAALAVDPKLHMALQNKASVLSEQLGRTEEAVAVLDRAIAAWPTAVDSLAGRGVLLARLGRREAALKDAEAVIALDVKPLLLYQVACIYALTSKAEPADREPALRWLTRALKDDPELVKYPPIDPDMATVRSLPPFRSVIAAAQLLHSR